MTPFLHRLFCLVWVCLVAQSCLTLCDPMDCSLPGAFVHGILQARMSECAAHQAPLFIRFFRQEYWSGLPFPSPENLPNPRIEAMSPGLLYWQADSLPLSHQGSPGLRMPGIKRALN